MCFQGRFFFACDGKRNETCKFFKWTDDVSVPRSAADVSGGSKQTTVGYRLQLNDAESIATYIRGQGVTFYCECSYLKKAPDSYKPVKNIPVSIT